MKCNYCGSRDIELSRLEKVGMNAAELLLERVERQNEYIKELSEGDFTAKVFRTWGGSRLSIDYLEDAKKDVEENPRKKIETALVQRVAKKLGNTVSICRDYYIHPKVLEVVAQPEFKMPRISNAKKYQHLDNSEQVVLKILMEG